MSCWICWLATERASWLVVVVPPVVIEPVRPATLVPFWVVGQTMGNDSAKEIASSRPLANAARRKGRLRGSDVSRPRTRRGSSAPMV